MLNFSKAQTSSTPNLPWWPLLLPLAVAALLYAATAFIVENYYRTRLPHYDSVGYYADLFNLMNSVQRDGWGAALTRATAISTSWLLPAFALLFAWTPIRAPWLLVGLNFPLLAAALLSLIVYLRTTGVGPWRQVVGSVTLLLPAIFYVWDGGLVDLRRDCQYVLLLAGVFYMGLAWASAPTWGKAVALGILAGFTIWSRDNAASGLAIVSVPIVLLALRRQGILTTLRQAIVPAIVFLALSTPYIALTAKLTWFRYNFVVWGIGEDRAESLQQFWTAPLDVMRGGVTHFNGMPANGTSSTELFAALGVLLLAGFVAGLLRLEPARLRQQWVAELAFSGSWVILAVIGYHCLLLGYGARWHGMPFMPTLIGMTAIVVALGNALAQGPRVDRRPALRSIVPILAVALIVGAAPWRMIASSYPYRGADVVDNTRDASLAVARAVGNKGVFQLWISGFSNEHVNFYATMAGLSPVNGVDTHIADEPGAPFVPVQPLRPTDDPAVLRQKLLLIAHESAPYILLAEDPSLYRPGDDAFGQYWLLAIGRPAIEALLNDPQFVPVAHFTVNNAPLVVLENRRLVSQAASPG